LRELVAYRWSEVWELLDDFAVDSVSQLNKTRETGKKTNRTKATTSSAEGLLESPRNSMSAWTTFAATSENLTANT
jgi:hypothetical protein